MDGTVTRPGEDPMSQSTPTPSGAAVPASDAPTNPWWRLLGLTAAVSAVAVVATAVIGLLFSGVPALVSAALAGVVVLIFFGISLALAAIVGHLAPRALMASFLMAYIVKVVAFGALLMVPHDPAWFRGAWVTAGAVVAVIVWQGCEMALLSRMRLRIFDDPASTGTTPSSAAASASAGGPSAGGPSAARGAGARPKAEHA